MPASSDTLILVSPQDQEIGQASKESCHDGQGLLHRAFSVFLFNERGQVLLQQRSEQKRLWPLHWSNSCCSHPRAGEAVDVAAARRLGEELGVEAKLTYLYKFEYQASFGAAGSEHELCYVYVGRADRVRHDPAEIAAVRYVDMAALDAELKAKPEQFTPWIKLEWTRLIGEYRLQLTRLF